MQDGLDAAGGFLVDHGGSVVDVDDEIGLGVIVLGDFEAVDVAGFTNENDVGGGVLLAGLEVGDVGGTGDGPRGGVAGNVVEDDLRRRQNDHGGVPHPGLDENVLQQVLKMNALGGLRRGRQQE